MSLKQILKRTKHHEDNQQCIICQAKLSTIPTLLEMDRKIIKQRHFYPKQKSNYVIIIAKILSNKQSSEQKKSFSEVDHLNKDAEYMNRYHNFLSIVKNIKSIILKRSEKDKNQTMHFFGQAYQYILHRNIKKRALNIGKYQQKTIEKCNGSGSQTAEQKKIKSPYEKQGFQKDSQVMQIRKLTKNLQYMVKKFQQNQQFHPSSIFQMDPQPGQTFDITKSFYRQLFRRQFEDNISAIMNKKQIEYLRTNPERTSSMKYIDGYGISPKDCHRTHFKKIQKRKITVVKSGQKVLLQNYHSPIVRFQTDYDFEAVKNNKKSVSGKRLSEKSPRSVLGQAKKQNNSKIIGQNKCKTARAL